MSYTFTDKETARTLVDMELSNMRFVLGLYDGVIEVVKKFNGRVFNKRFETALNAVNDNIYVQHKYSSIYIKFHCSKDHFNPDCSKGYRCTQYIINREISMNEYMNTEQHDEKFCVCTIDEKFNYRIDAEKMIVKLLQRKESIEAEIKEIEENINKVNEYEAKLNELVKQIESTTKEIPFLLAEYFALKYRVVRDR